MLVSFVSTPLSTVVVAAAPQAGQPAKLILQYVDPEIHNYVEGQKTDVWMWNSGTGNYPAGANTTSDGHDLNNVNGIYQTEPLNVLTGDNIEYIIRFAGQWGIDGQEGPGIDRLEPGDRSLRVNLGDPITKVRVTKDPLSQYTFPSPITAKELGNIVFRFRDWETFATNTQHTLTDVKVIINGIAYPMTYDAETEMFIYILESPEAGEYSYQFAIGEGEPVNDIYNDQTDSQGRSVIIADPPSLAASIEIYDESFTTTVDAITLEPAEAVRVKAVVRDAEGNVLTNEQITWSSTDSNIARASYGGMITATAPAEVLQVRTATITATCGSVQAHVNVTVNPAKPSFIWVTSNRYTLSTTGSTRTATVDPYIHDRYGYRLNQVGGAMRNNNFNIEWTSSNEEVATVVKTTSGNNAGRATVTAVAPGTTTITVTVSSIVHPEIVISQSCEFFVADPDDVTTGPALTMPVTATVFPDTIGYDQNAVLTLITDEPNAIASAVVDMTNLGATTYNGNPLKLPIDMNNGAISLYVREGIPAGEKIIPVTITDKAGNESTIYATLTIDPSIKTKDFDWDEAVIYFLLTDRFYDGDPSNNNAYGLDEWNPDKAESFHGGDLKGVLQKLDYLQDLGVNTIWITPIVENTHQMQHKETNQFAYHGYWAKDFTKIDPHLGTVEDLDALLDAAHDRGMKIMVDIVLNHSGYPPIDEFMDAGMIRTSLMSGDHMTALGDGWIRLPDFKTEDPAVRNQLVAWQAAWINHKTARGNSIDFFRVDTAKHVDNETWQALKNAAVKINPQFKMIGEDWTSNTVARPYLYSAGMDALLDFDYANRARNFVGTGSNVGGNVLTVHNQLVTRSNQITNYATLGQFLSSHDQPGFLNQFAGNPADVKRGKGMVAASLQLTDKGIPVIYYGEELMRQDQPYSFGADSNRRDMKWSNYTEDELAMLAHYKKLLSIRKEYSKLFAKGDRGPAIAGSNADKYLVFTRSYQDQKLYIGLNTNNTRIDNVTFATGLEEGTIISDLYSGTMYKADANGNVTISLPASSEGGTAILVAGVRPTAQERIRDGVILHAFDWNLNVIEENLQYIAEAGFTAIQTSPVHGCSSGSAWSAVYQPRNMIAGGPGNRYGSRDDLVRLTSAAAALGLKIIVDVVPNHMGGGADAPWNDNTYFHNVTSGVGYNDRFLLTQPQMISGLRDLNTHDPFVQQSFINYLKDLIDAGVSGFRYDAIKHIELDDDVPSPASIAESATNPRYPNGEFASDYVKNVTTAVKEYFAEKGKENFQYGEVLQGGDPNMDRMAGYARYLDLTASMYGHHVRNVLEVGDIGRLDKWADYAAEGLTPDRLVPWVESHDTYNNEGESMGFSPKQIRQGWAMIASRKDASPLFFARNINANGSRRNNVRTSQYVNYNRPQWTHPEVVAINNFHNAMAGRDENLVSLGNNAVMIERGTDVEGGGAVLINTSTSDRVLGSVPVRFLKDGYYVNALDANNVFVVANGRISGTIPGNTANTSSTDTSDNPGIVVLMGRVSQDSPILTAYPNDDDVIEGDCFTGDQLRLRLSAINVANTSYSVNNGDLVQFGNDEIITVGVNANYNEPITITLVGQTNEGDWISNSFTYTRVEPEGEEEPPAEEPTHVKVYFSINRHNGFKNWANNEFGVWCYTFNPELFGGWSGAKMTRMKYNGEDTHWYMIEMPRLPVGGIIFNTINASGTGQQTGQPAITSSMLINEQLYFYGTSNTTTNFNITSATWETAFAQGNGIGFTESGVFPPGRNGVFFDTSGGSSIPDQFVRDGEKAARPADPTRSGYLFDGKWYTDPECTQEFDFNTPIVNTFGEEHIYALTLYAGWIELEEGKYLVEFNTQGGSHVMSIPNVTGGSTISEPAAPVRSGYTFEGWFKDVEGTTPWNFDTDVITESTTLYAKWELVDYTITYLDGENLADMPGSAPATYNVETETFALPAPNEKTGYTFEGWYTNPQFLPSSKVTSVTVNSVGDLTVYARFIPNTYSITLNPQGGSKGSETISVSYGSKLPASIVIPEKEGYSFQGFYQNTDGQGQQYYNRYGVRVFGDNWTTASDGITFYAYWISSSNAYTVSFETNGGSVVPPVTDVPSGSTITKPADPKKGTYVFAGWYKEPELLTEWNFATDTVTGDITLYAKWQSILVSVEEPASITGVPNGTAKTAQALGLPTTVTIVTSAGEQDAAVSWNVEASSYDPSNKSAQTFTVSGTVTLPAGTENPDSVGLQVTIQVTVNAEITYTVRFESNGGSDVPQITNVSSGSTITKPADPTKGTYVFAGWYKEPELLTEWNFETDTVTGDITLYAKWTNVLISVEGPGPITGIANGTAKTAQALGLPTTVTIVTSAGNVEADVSWDVEACVYNPSSKSAQTFTVSGTITLPEGIENPNSVELEVTIEVTVNAGTTTPTTPPPTSTPAPTSNTTSTVTVSDDSVAIYFQVEPSITGNTATATVSTAEVVNAISNEMSGDTQLGVQRIVEIDVETDSQISDVKLTISNTAFSEVNNASVDKLSISTSVATVTFDKSALEAIEDAASGDVTINIATVDVSTLSLTADVRAAVSDRPVYDFTLTRGNTVISDFNGGLATVVIPYTLREGEDPNAIVVYYLDNEGKLKMTIGVYDTETNTVKTVLSHFSKYVVGHNEVPFDDVAKDAWYYPSATFVNARNLFNGILNANLFEPNSNVTRAMFVQIFANIEGADLSGYSTSPYLDVDINSPYGPAIAWATEKGIVVGGGNGIFAPDEEISREQMALILYNYMKYKGITFPEVQSKTFTDSSSISSWAADAVYTMTRYGIINGGSNNMFVPRGKAQRASVATIIMNFIKAWVK